MANLPYVTASGNVEKALQGIKNAATPERVSQDFVKTILGIKGGSGNQMTSFLKKIGFVNADGSPSDLYKRFRNTATTGSAAAEALKIGYAPLYSRNEYMHKMKDEDLKGLLLEETGQGGDSAVVGLIFSAIKNIKKFATFDSAAQPEGFTTVIRRAEPVPNDPPAPPAYVGEGLGINLGYTINLNLPATSDVAVFNAIFKSPKENLLRNE